MISKPPFVTIPVVIATSMSAPIVANIVAIILSPILPLVPIANATRQILDKFSVARSQWPITWLSRRADVAGPISWAAGTSNVTEPIARLTRRTNITGSLIRPSWTTGVRPIGARALTCGGTVAGARLCWQCGCDLSRTGRPSDS